MPKYRKMLSDINAPYLQSLMRLIETQSKATLAHWCIDYVRVHILPIYEKTYPDDSRCKNALAAREAGDSPAAQAAARTCGQAAATIHTPTHSLGLALYGALAVAYDKLGADAKWDALVGVAAEECGKVEAAAL